jgi:hypothetical protein
VQRLAQFLEVHHFRVTPSLALPFTQVVFERRENFVASQLLKIASCKMVGAGNNPFAKPSANAVLGGSFSPVARQVVASTVTPSANAGSVVRQAAAKTLFPRWIPSTNTKRQFFQVPDPQILLLNEILFNETEYNKKKKPTTTTVTVFMSFF